ncbi:MAG: hypothetical protein J07AB43_00760 [Candidatus Nanosalina sp. J07AB43]|jgi:hypothetical protein|nr:MAG: hypothetical protein J07AB43_00760 [Candidatus Nanosalina sp. J07AB43]
MSKLRLLAGSAIVAGIGYVIGTVYGYRAAVVDYVENDANTIERIADTMYDTESFEDLPEALKEQLRDAGMAPDSDDGGSDDREKGFQ